MRDGRFDPSPHPKSNWGVRVEEATIPYTFENDKQRELCGSLMLWRHRFDPYYHYVIMQNGTLLRAVCAVDAKTYAAPWIRTTL